MYTIMESGVRIGFFRNESDRDDAFNKYVLPRSTNCVKSQEED